MRKKKSVEVQPVYIEEIMAKDFLTYSHAVITGRSIPDIRDGLKPVQRRILYAMKDTHDLVKCARTIGDTLGKYHPHGDCVRNDSILYALDGSMRTIEELYNSGVKELEVLAYDEKTGKYKSAIAHSFRIGQYTNKIYKITMYDGGVIECTSNHPFYVRGKGWTSADKIIEKEDYLECQSIYIEDKSMHDSIVPLVRSVEIINVDNEPMYDFTVDEYQNALMITKTTDNTIYTVATHNSSVYDSLIRMAQDWKMYVPYIHSQGNFGSIDGDPAAAYRYTESKLDGIAYKLFFKYNQLGIPYKDNYDNKDKEPAYLGAILPMFLINGAIGTAVGYSTAIPTHNVKEVINTYKAFIEGKLNNTNIRKYLKGPDMVMSCNIIDSGGINRAYATGRGSFHCMLPYHIEPNTRGRQNIVFTSVLPNTSKADSISKLADIVNTKNSKLSQMISNLADESDKDEIRVIVTVKKDIDVKVVIEELINVKFCHNRYIMSHLLIVDGAPVVMGIMDMLRTFHEHQKEVSIKHLKANIEKLHMKLHIVEGMSIIVKDCDGVTSAIRLATSRQDAILRLKKKFKTLTDIQINAILDMKLYSLINRGKNVLDDIKLLKAEIKNIQNYIDNIDTYILKNLDEIYVDTRAYHKRRCVIEKTSK